MRTAIGVDVGGTKVAASLVGEDGRALERLTRPTPADEPDAVVETLGAIAEELRTQGDPAAVGVGAAGMVDSAAGVLRWAPNLAWKEVPLRDLVSERLGLPCVVDNDANAAAWGEYRFGAGRDTRDLLVVTVGTGIGGGIVAGGRLYRGANGFAAEIGHVIVEPNGPRCGCGNQGCWEQVASGSALARMGRETAAANPDSILGRLAEDGEVTGPTVVEAADRGDRRAGALLAEIGRRLGEGIAGLVNILDPDRVVIGGGVAEVGDRILAPAREAFLRAVEAPDHRPEVRLVPAALGNDAGAIGAAALALEGAGA